jgi:hypothetical protein
VYPALPRRSRVRTRQCPRAGGDAPQDTVRPHRYRAPRAVRPPTSSAARCAAGIHATRHPADDAHTGASQGAGQPPRDALAVAGHLARAHNRHARAIEHGAVAEREQSNDSRLDRPQHDREVCIPAMPRLWSRHQPNERDRRAGSRCFRVRPMLGLCIASRENSDDQAGGRLKFKEPAPPPDPARDSRRPALRATTRRACGRVASARPH